MTNHVFAPPGHAFPIESVTAMRAGHVGVQIAGGAAAGGASRFENASLAVRARTGLSRDFEGSLTVAAMGTTGTTLVGASVRAGAKYQLADSLAVSFGLALGGAAEGSFLGPDVALVVANENPGVVPFAAFRLWMTSPLSARDILLREADAAGGTVAYRSTFAGGVQGTVGFRAPIYHEGSGATRVHLTVAIGAFVLGDATESSSGLYIGGGPEAVF